MGFNDYSQKHGKYMVFLVILGMLLPLASMAQATLEIGLQGGSAYYNGDINPGKPYVMPQVSYGLLARYNFDDRWSAKFTFTHGKIKGDNLIAKVANYGALNFLTTLDDASLTGEFNFMNYATGSKKKSFSPYLMGGIGVFFYNPTVENPVPDTTCQAVNKSDFAVVFGLGFKYSLSKRLGAGIEWSMHKTFTDCLDGVQQNGNDWYNFTQLSLTYKIDLIKNNVCNTVKW